MERQKPTTSLNSFPKASLFDGRLNNVARVGTGRFCVKMHAAGLPAWLSCESGQVRKEAATAMDASAGGKARHFPGFRGQDSGIRV